MMKIKKGFFTLLLLGNFSISNAQRSLMNYIDSAKINSPLIKDNQNQTEANRLEIERLKAQFTKPQVGLNGNYFFAPILSTDNNKTSLELNSKGAQKYYGYDLGLSNGGLYQGLVTITQPLFYQERYKAYEEQANISTQMNQNNIKLAVHDIEKFVTDQYILCLLDLNQTRYAQDMVELLEQQRVIVQKLVSSALLKQSDYSLLNIEYKNFEEQLLLSRANYRKDVMDLNILAGINDTSLVAIDTLVLAPHIDASSFASQYLEGFRLDSLNLAVSQKIFETRYKPQVNVFANSGLNTSNISTVPRRFGVGAGVSVIWNFYDGKQKDITRRKTAILLNSVSSYRDNFLSVNEVRKNKFITELGSYKERAALLQQQLSDYQSVINSYRRELLSGQQTVINFINTIRNMALIQRDYALLQTNQLLLINAYNYWNW
jgi:outer membrane protein TolC